MVLLLKNSFKWQSMAGARAEIKDKGGAGVGAENKQFRLRNTELFNNGALQHNIQSWHSKIYQI